MKPSLPIFFLLAILHTAFNGKAQVTQLSDNTNLELLIPLPTTAILISDVDSLWRTDGTAAGTFKYATHVAADTLHKGFVFKNKYYFSGVDANGEELWVTDGTAAGTTLVKNIKPGAASSSPKHYIEYNNALYFFADDGVHGMELWKSDGTTGGTALLKDINPNAANSVETTTIFSYFFLNNKLYFTATDGVNGIELWVTDGTTAGTEMVKNINAGSNSSNPMWFHQYGSTVLFSATTGAPTVFAPGVVFQNHELWKTDGTADGTVPVKSFGVALVGTGLSGFKTFNNKVFFNGYTEQFGMEGWVTDGTTANTLLLKDIYEGNESGIPMFINSFVFNNKMIFSATSETKGRELWQTDGTPLNTTLFKDINPDEEDGNPIIYPYFTNTVSGNPLSTGFFKGLVFMSASTPENGTEIWKSDGTPAGTTILKDIYPGPDSSMNDDHFTTFFFTPDHLYFSATEESFGNELWKSDGTEAGTTRVIDINPGTGSSDPQFIGVFNGIYFFTAHDGDNTNDKRDLFRLNGTFSSIPLPLNLLSFSGSLAGVAATLSWTTSGEKNTDHFIVERSYNGNQFAAAGKIAAQKSGSDKNNYSFQDAEATQGTGNQIYYRLKMVDNDGKFTYSRVISFNRVPSARLVIYPNPVKDELRLTVETGVRKQLSLQIFDEVGKQVYQQKLFGNSGNNSYGINVSHLAKGSYILTVNTEDGTETKRFIKQ